MANAKSPNENAESLKRAAEAVLSGAVFQRSKANTEMLIFLVEETLAGRANQVGEYSIAIDLMGRGGDFDPSTDPIVRVRMRRLREALSRHYALSGDATVTKIVLPKGRYKVGVQVPDMVPEDVDHAQGHARMGLGQTWMSQVLRLLAAAFLGLALVALIWDIWRYQHSPNAPNGPFYSEAMSEYPLIDILAFQNETGRPENDRFERDFQLKLAADIQNFGRLRVRVASLDDPGRPDEVSPRFQMSGLLLNLDDKADIFTTLIDRDTGSQILSARFSLDVPQGDISATLSTLSEMVTGQIVGQSGAVSRFLQDMIASDTSAAALGVLRCVTLTDMFLESLRPEDHLTARSCFAPYVKRGFKDPVAASSWGLLMFHAVPEFQLMLLEGVPPDDQHARTDVLQYAENLVDRFPSSAAAFLLVGAIHSASAEPLRAITALQRAVVLNPADPTAHSILSYAYMATDQHHSALEAAQKAIRETADPLPFMFLPVLVAAVVDGNTPLAVEAAQALALQKSPGTDAALLAAAQMSGNLAQVQRLRPKVEALSYPMQGLDIFVRGHEAVEAFSKLFMAAGVLDAYAPRSTETK
jgi:tetratricopeptide (TPR) repeat protein